jgi:hypothetical protein
MRCTSLVVELIRARPRLVVWIVVLVQAGLWLFLPMLLYRSPPGDVATVLAHLAGSTRSAPGSVRRWRSGSPTSPSVLPAIPCSASYLLAQACAVVTFWIYYQAGPRDRRRAAGRASRYCFSMTVVAVQFAGRRVRPAGAGAPAMGAAVAVIPGS